MYEVSEWHHVFKLDPDKYISDEDLEKICESGTDGIIIGGTDGITLEKVLDLMARVRRYTVPCVLEVSEIDAITPGYDLFFIPTVLNSTDTKWVKGLHHEAVKEYGEIMNWEEILVQGYCVLNAECKVAELTNAKTDLTVEDVKAYAMMAEKMFHLPIFYIEYSGKYGDVEIVKETKAVLDETVLFYGGGIQSVEQAREMGAHADVVVVGNVVYEDLKVALQTVDAVKQ
ncbi:heptaprenylglyceryl phosphate synthase [Cytobacillus purgationiresistens]|uniref:Heptaprenylglyceryl phosphate synthase n=1 Tax=Cytobacillus purgationiresistens TaxID=863449 RepID=A0ABU0AR92_9BACI|nr:heptaprenylglyceryl phosphate synthase [Cytobacillus purgationiresistens]MDQ0272928.1 putative glycerol-1-phosphate prenyltransferase [Cytobacillus purgationiresistens]